LSNFNFSPIFDFLPNFIILPNYYFRPNFQFCPISIFQIIKTFGPISIFCPISKIFTFFFHFLRNFRQLFVFLKVLPIFLIFHILPDFAGNIFYTVRNFLYRYFFSGVILELVSHLLISRRVFQGGIGWSYSKFPFPNTIFHIFFVLFLAKTKKGK